MPMIRLAILISVALLLAVAVLALYVSIRSKKMTGLSDEVQSMVRDAKVEPYERPSSLVAEQIEEMVRRKLEQHPDLADVVFDFGTMPDGTIDIWVNRKQYDNIEDIPDERIRRAIGEAVEEFSA
jgi:hypothetical protein